MKTAGLELRVDWQRFERGKTLDQIPVSIKEIPAKKRGMQQRTIPSFPIVRFSWRERIAATIGHDSSSDDLFDSKIEKDGLTEAGVMEAVRQNLEGLEDVYEAAEKSIDVETLLAIDNERWEAWGHPNFASRMAQGDRAYLRAGLIMRLLGVPGLLIDDMLASFRLGVDRERSADWPKILLPEKWKHAT